MKKVCKRCATEKDLSDFHVNKLCAGGKLPICKACKSIVDKAYRSTRKAEISARDKAYSLANKDQINKKKKEYRERNREKLLIADRRYREENFESFRAAIKKWSKTSRGIESTRRSQQKARKSHPEKDSARAAVKRAVMSGRLTKMPCEICGQADTHGHHEDYSKQLEVKWLCPLHHRMAHSKKR